MPLMKVLSHPDCPWHSETRIVGIKEVWQSLAEAIEIIPTQPVPGTDLRTIEFTDKAGRRCSVCLNPFMMSRLLALQEMADERVAEKDRLRELFGALDLCPEQTEG